MRGKEEMLALILKAAEGDERIRVVILNGSRANPHAPGDIFQDFDIVYYVTDVAPFKRNLDWIQRFGEIMILQMPEDMGDPPPVGEEGFVYLMQFTDGNRIDLSIRPLSDLKNTVDSLSVLLLDKDQILAPLNPPGESDYLPKPPTARAFSDCCNEFWWVCPYVAKGLWRKEIVYAKYMLDTIAREELMKMLAWYVGLQTGFSANPGYHGKYLQKYLLPNLWDLLQKTYAGAGYEQNWEALLAMGSLFRTAAVPIADHYGFAYHEDEDRKVTAHLEHVRRLPADAAGVY